MSLPPGPGDEAQLLSDAEIEGIGNFVQSAEPLNVTNRGPTFGTLLYRGLGVVANAVTLGKTKPTSTDTWMALNDMSIRAPLDKQLQFLFGERGFRFGKEPLPDPYDHKKIRHYTAVTRDDYKLALVQLP